MSIDVMSAVWKLKDLADSEMLILLAMADWADRDGVCWPSVAQLADKTNKGERTIQGAIKAIVAKGHLTRVEVPGRGCRYVVHPRSGCTPAAAAPPQPTAKTPAAAAPNTSRHTTSPKASLPKKKRAAAPPAFVPPSDIPEAEWNDFEEMRRRIGKPMTAKARDLAIGRLRKLADDGYPPGDVLNHSILNNYQGLFPPKDRQHADNRTNRQSSDRPVDGFTSALRRASAKLGADDFG